MIDDMFPRIEQRAGSLPQPARSTLSLRKAYVHKPVMATSE